jgi:hypothetical protein
MTDQRFNANNHCASNAIELDMSSLYSPFLRMAGLCTCTLTIGLECTQRQLVPLLHSAHGRVVLALALRHLPLQLPSADTHGYSDNDNCLGSLPMRPKARGLAQHGGPSGWLEKSDPERLEGVILYMMDRPYCLSFP